MDPAESIHVPTEHGRGRTGIVAGRIFIEFGDVPETAPFRVRRARSGTVESQRQEDHLRGLVEALGTP